MYMYNFSIFFNVNFHQEPQQTSQTTFTKLTFSRARYARGFCEVISAFFNINIDLGISKTRTSNKQTHQN